MARVARSRGLARTRRPLVRRNDHLRHRASFAINMYLSDAAVNWAFYSLPARAWELGLGGLLAAFGVRVERVPAALPTFGGWIGLAAIGAAAMMFDSSSITYPGIAATVPALGAMLIIAAGSCRVGPGRILTLPPFRAVGRISFSLYLVHWPLLVLGPIALGLDPDAATNTLLVLLALIAAAVCWAAVETPFRTGLPVLVARPRRTLSASMSVILAVAVVAGLPSLDAGPVAGAGTAVELRPTDQEAHVASGSSPELDLRSGSDLALADPTADVPAETPAATPDSATHGPLPNDVRPALAAARHDEERLRADGCLAFEPVVVPPKCVYGVRKAAYTIALVGDSHAAQWFPALERLAPQERWRIVTFVKVSCPLIDMAVRNLALEREYRECAAFDKATIDQLTDLRPDLTIVSMSRISIHPMRASDDTVAAKGAAVGRMVSRIPGRVAIVVDTPSPRGDVPACLSAHASKVDACAIPGSTAFAADFSAIEHVAAAASGAALIDLTDRICADDPCPVVVDRTIVFRDGEHMTATFSSSLAPALDAEISRVVNAPAGRDGI